MGKGRRQLLACRIVPVQRIKSVERLYSINGDSYVLGSAAL